MTHRSRREIERAVESLAEVGGTDGPADLLAFETAEGDLVDGAGEPIGEDSEYLFVAPWSLQQAWAEAADGGEWLPDGAPILDEDATTAEEGGRA